MEKYKIAIFTPYFGHINEFFKIWLNSAAWNNTIDFFIPTDCSDEIVSTGLVRNNIHVIKTSLEDIKSMMSRLVGFECNIDHPRKICDYRSCLGLLYKDILKDYDYWGYTDNDQIYGNIRKFISDDLLDRNDKIGMWGHFSLFRNIEPLNTLFMKDFREHGLPYYKDVFKTPYNCFFEETPIFKFAELAGYKCYEDESKIFDCSYTSFRFINKKWDKRKKPYLVAFRKGDVTVYEINGNKLSGGKEVLYAHFQKRRFCIERLNLANMEFLCFYPNFVVNMEQFNEKEAIKWAKKKRPMYGLKKKIAHKFAVKYNNFHRKHSKKFKQLYY